MGLQNPASHLMVAERQPSTDGGNEPSYLLLDEVPLTFTQRGQEAGPKDWPLSVAYPPSCRFMAPPPGLAGALVGTMFQD